jgi:hypothetical protein
MKRLAALLCGLAASSACAADVQPVSNALCADMQRRGVINAGAPVGCERLVIVRFDYVGFDGALHNDGRIVVLDAVGEHVGRLFDALRAARFPIRKAVPINAYDGDDDRSIADDNTSAFNHRRVDGSSGLSQHSYGTAIDINPIENPYIEKGKVSPPSGAAFVARQPQRAGMVEPVVRIFAAHGFRVWGGRWARQRDYQHFHVEPALARRLIALPPAQAKATFAAYAGR